MTCNLLLVTEFTRESKGLYDVSNSKDIKFSFVSSPIGTHNTGANPLLAAVWNPKSFGIHTNHPLTSWACFALDSNEIKAKKIVQSLQNINHHDVLLT